MKKKVVQRLIAAVLTPVVLFNSFTLDSSAKEISEEITDAAEEEKEENEDYPETLCEIVDERSEYSKAYELDDFTHVAVLYSEPVHFENEEGELVEIDNSIVETEDGYTNVENSYDVTFQAGGSSDATVVFEEEDYEISWTFSDEEKVELTTELKDETEERDDDFYVVPETSITYSGFSKNFALEYLPQSLGVKENIILADKSCENIYTFALNIKGLNISINNSGEAELRDKETDELKYYFPAPFMADAKGNMSTNVKFVLGKVGPEDLASNAEENASEENLDVSEDNTEELQAEADETDEKFEVLSEDNEIEDALENIEETEEKLDYKTETTDEIVEDVFNEETDDDESDIIYLSIVADNIWLENAAYPVAIDPEIKKANASGIIEFGSFNSQGVSQEKLYVGKRNESINKVSTPVSYNSYLKFVIPDIPKQSIISKCKAVFDWKRNNKY